MIEQVNVLANKDNAKTNGTLSMGYTRPLVARSERLSGRKVSNMEYIYFKYININIRYIPLVKL